MTNEQRQLIGVFGEVLLDEFPDGSRVLGGAPFNVAWHLQGLGLAPRLVSRIGTDANGRTVTEAMERWGMDTDAMQVDAERPTGTVGVNIVDGEPRYDITTGAAWDAIAEPRLATCDVLYHGSLALRSSATAQALEACKVATKPGLIFFDVNLRAPWWSLQQVQVLLADADWLKVNEDELAILQPDPAEKARGLLDQFDLQGLIITRGAEGAEVYTAAGTHDRAFPDHGAPVVDTVGAGDAFAAVMITGLVEGWPLADALQRAQQLAAHVVARRGAIAEEPGYYTSLIHEWREGR